MLLSDEIYYKVVFKVRNFKNVTDSYYLTIPWLNDDYTSCIGCISYIGYTGCIGCTSFIGCSSSLVVLVGIGCTSCIGFTS